MVIYKVNGQQISDCVQEGDVFYFRNGEESGSNLEDHKPAIRIIRRRTVREGATSMSPAAFANWRETASLSRCRMKRLELTLFQANRNGSRSPTCVAVPTETSSTQKETSPTPVAAAVFDGNPIPGRPIRYCLFAKASSRLRRSMTNVLLSPYSAHGPGGTS